MFVELTTVDEITANIGAFFNDSCQHNYAFVL